MKKLANLIIDMLLFHGIDPEAIDNIEYNCDTIWIDVGDTTYCLSLSETE